MECVREWLRDRRWWARALARGLRRPLRGARDGGIRVHPTHLLVVGALLVVMALLRSRVDVLPLSTGLVYLVIGWTDRAGTRIGVLRADPFAHTQALQVVFEIAVLVSLFAVGLEAAGAGRRSRPGALPVRLAVPSMLFTIAGVDDGRGARAGRAGLADWRCCSARSSRPPIRCWPPTCR